MPNPVMRFYSEEQLSPRRALTPEGFLLCSDVAIARCGTMLYSAGEVPVEADQDGLIRIHREPEDVFAPSAIASFNGKPVTNDHPPEKVSPGTYRTYAVGTVLNPRRGDGLIEDNEFLFADLLITDMDAIKAIRSGFKTETSAGYDAEYLSLAPGVGRQTQIIGNHVALVDRGRCGPKCYIGDSDMSRRRVSDAVLAASVDRIRRAFTARDESTLVDELDRVSTMLGDILAGANESGGFAGVEAPVKGYGGGTEDARRTVRDETHIHVHAGGGDDAVLPGGGAPPGAGTPPPAAGGAPDPAAAGGDPMQSIMQRLEALERAIAILAQEGGEDPNMEEDPNGDPSANPPDDGGEEPSKDRARGMRDARRRTRDDEPAAPPTEEPSDASSKENVALDHARRRMVGDSRATVGDSSSMAAAWRELLSRAEILAPGVRPSMTFDARRPAKTTFDAMCQFRRKALSEAMQEDDTRDIIQRVEGSDPKLAQMTCDGVTRLFNASSEMARQANSGRTAAVGDGRGYHERVNGVLQSTVQDINKRNKEFYKVQH